MAEMTKKLHFLKNGTEQTAKAYSTTAEAGSSYITNVIDNTTCYIPIGATGDAQATIGRVTKGGTTYAIKSQAKPAYAEKSWTTAGTYTWTAPAGVTRVRVAVCGGGGGGSAYGGINYWGAGGTGGTSNFGGLISATGGSGGSTLFVDDGESSNPGEYKAGIGGSPNGRNGYARNDITNAAGGTGFALSFTLANGGYGNGGKAVRRFPEWSSSLAGGGSGGYNSNYVYVSSGTTYTVVVGAGGNGFTGNSYNGARGYSGNTGFVLIAYGGDI